jgi:hypothetical protein
MLTLLFALAAAVAAADQTFVRAAAAGDASAVAAVLDQDFTWTDASGHTLDAAHAKQARPKPALANEAARRRLPTITAALRSCRPTPASCTPCVSG